MSNQPIDQWERLHNEIYRLPNTGGTVPPVFGNRKTIEGVESLMVFNLFLLVSDIITLVAGFFTTSLLCSFLTSRPTRDTTTFSIEPKKPVDETSTGFSMIDAF